MKKLRKAIALFVVMVMAMSLMPRAIMAEESNDAYMYGWYSDNAATPNDNVKSYIATEPTVTGGHSLYMQHNDKGQEWKAAAVAQNITLTEGTYTLSLWVAGQYDSAMSAVIFEGDEWQEHKLNTFETGTDEINYFLQFTKTISVPAGKTNSKIRIVSNGNSAGFYVDDISLVKEGTEVNLVGNGGFEFDGTPEYTEEHAAYMEGWTQNCGFEPDKNLTFLCITDEIAHSGSKSVVIRHTDTNKEWNGLFLDQDISIGEGTYTLSFWSAGDYSVSGYNAVIFEGGQWESHNLDTFTNSQTVGIWKKYEKTITVPAGVTQNRIRIVSNGSTNAWLIDDISLVKEGTTENLITNGGFELRHEHEYGSWTSVDEDNHRKICGCGDIVTEAHSWDDGVVTTQPTITTEGAMTYTCTVCYATKTEVVEKMAPSESDSAYLYPWTIDSAATETDDTKAYITNSIAATGANSLYIKHNDKDQAWKAVKVSQDIYMPAGEYTLSFWISGTYDSNTCTILFDGGDWQTHKFNDGYTIGETVNGFTEMSKQITIDEGYTNTEISIASDGNTEGFYIDNISLVKAGTNVNMLGNSGFEFGYTEEHTAYMNGWTTYTGVEMDNNLRFLCVTDTIAHSGSRSMVIRNADSTKEWNGNAIFLDQDISIGEGTYTLSFWCAGDYSVSGYNAVIFEGGQWESHNLNDFEISQTVGIWKKYEKTITVPAGVTQNKIRIVSNGSTNAWLIDDISLVKEGTTENLITNGGFEGEGYYITKPTIINLDSQDDELTELETGTLEVKVEIKNFTMGDSFQPVMIAALYNGQTLDEVIIAQQLMYQSGIEEYMEDELCVTIDVPEMTEETDYTLKVMCWEELDTLKPLRECVELKQN